MSIIREIVLDTETTGFDPEEGDRIIEIGCVELENHLPTGKHLQLFINPERDVPAEAIAIHGITNEFLKDKPIFATVYSEFIEFIGTSRLIIHNAEFDMKFLNWELQNVGHKALPWSQVLDTLQIARRKFPGSPANLDALCRRFGIDNTERTYHGALLDSELLAEVYLELLGGRQHGLILNEERFDKNTQISTHSAQKKPVHEPRPHSANEQECAAHAALLERLNDPIWKTKKA